MLAEIIERLLIVLFVMSTLNIVRNAFFLIQSWVKSDEDGVQNERYTLPFTSLFLLSLSIGYFITALIKGFNL